jgi:predicted enzyme related to lactoylglutathione lyase
MLRLADFAVTVTSATATAKWWKDAVGFEAYTLGAPGSHAIMVAPPGERFLLHLCEGFAAVEPGNTGIAFVTDDIEKHVRKMKAAGVQFPEPLKKESWGASAKFADPDGNIFWLLGAPTGFIRRETTRRALAASTPHRKSSTRRRKAREKR